MAPFTIPPKLKVPKEENDLKLTFPELSLVKIASSVSEFATLFIFNLETNTVLGVSRNKSYPPIITEQAAFSIIFPEPPIIDE
ncbi:MAG: hypothetical protein EBS09_12025 [Flavobacteriia bacterium]|nr:hypothetical protein [Flavobacteriia bacterium]